MASVTDIGGLGDPGTDPPLGGPDGWAAAVRDVLDSSDIPVNSRIAAAITGLAPGAHGDSHELGGSDEIEIDPYQVTGTAVVDGDARLSDARTPTSHASSHGSGGSDPVTVSQSQVVNLVADLAGKASTSHAAAHSSGGSDPVTVSQSQVSGLSAALSGKASTAHASTHAQGGSDPIFPIAQSQVTNLTADLALKAPLASPALTGTPTAPTPAVGDSSTKIATTAFVDGQRRVTHPNTDDVLVQIWDAGKGRWQTVHYDSGLRNVTADVANGTGTTTCQLRRVGASIEFDFEVTTFTSGATVYTLPTGFRPQRSRYIERTYGGLPMVVNANGTVVVYGTPHATQIRGTLQTLEAIPTSLPGTLVSAAPA